MAIVIYGINNNTEATAKTLLILLEFICSFSLFWQNMLIRERIPVIVVHNNVYINLLPPHIHDFFKVAKDYLCHPDLRLLCSLFYYAVMLCGCPGILVLTIGLACAWFLCGCITALRTFCAAPLLFPFPCGCIDVP